MMQFSVDGSSDTSDFVGLLDKNGDIKFTKDGNRWPRLAE